MLKRKGVSNVMWVVLAFIVVLILIVLGTLLLGQGKEYAVKGIDDLMRTVDGVITD